MCASILLSIRRWVVHQNPVAPSSATSAGVLTVNSNMARWQDNGASVHLSVNRALETVRADGRLSRNFEGSREHVTGIRAGSWSPCSEVPRRRSRTGWSETSPAPDPSRHSGANIPDGQGEQRKSQQREGMLRASQSVSGQRVRSQAEEAPICSNVPGIPHIPWPIEARRGSSHTAAEDSSL